MQAGTAPTPNPILQSLQSGEAVDLEESLDALLTQAGLDPADTIFQSDRVQAVTSGAKRSGMNVDVLGENEALPPPSPPPFQWTAKIQEAGESFINQMESVLDEALSTTPPLDSLPGETVQDRLAKYLEMTISGLLAAFLKLNIENPLNDPTNHAMLHDAASNARKYALEAQRDRIDEAELEIEQAEKEAEEASFWTELLSIVTTVITAVVAVVLAIAVLGPLIGPLVAAGTMLLGTIIGAMNGDAMMGAQLAAAALMVILSVGTMASLFSVASPAAMAMAKSLSLVSALVSGTSQIAQAGMQASAAQAMLDAQQTRNKSERDGLKAEQEQERVKQEAEIMQMIMEAKNRFVEAVIRMLSQNFASQARVLNI